MALSPEKLQEIKEQLEGLPQEEQQEKMQDILSQLPEEEVQEIMKQQCPFCLIVDNKINADVVYDDSLVKGVLDINPASKGHVILFPKKHYPLTTKMPDFEASHLFNIANKLSDVVLRAVDADGINIFVANGQVAGQNSSHVLVHIIPRFRDDKIPLSWNPQKISVDEMKEIADKIKSINIPSEEREFEEPEIEKEDFEEVERIPR